LYPRAALPGARSSATLKNRPAVEINGAASDRERPLVSFVVESGTDVRMVEGLAERFELEIFARRIIGGVEISQQPSIAVRVRIGAPSRAAFAREVFRFLTRRNGRPDFVIVQGYGLAALAANLASRITGIPTAMLVCSPTEDYYRCRGADRSGRLPMRRRELLAMSAVARLNARLARRYVVLSQYLRDVVRARSAGAPVDVIPIYGVDTELFRPPSIARAQIRAERGLPASGSIIFFSSRIAPEKDAETMLAAFASLAHAGRDLRLLHRSGGFETFVAAAGKFDIADRVIASDAVHPHRELPLDYQASDLCVQASRAEGLGFSPLEAMACGTPVIAAAVGGLRETVQEGHTGWQYPAGDRDALARRITDVLDNPAEAQRRARAARELVCAHFDRRFVFDQLESLVRAETDRKRSEVFVRKPAPALREIANRESVP
jgi:glycosyltransferase involved in cell wall biosynthesis